MDEAHEYPSTSWEHQALAGAAALLEDKVRQHEAW